MAFYTDLGDGSYQVETDDGNTLRTAMDPMQLEQMGVMPKPKNVQSFDSANTVALGRGEVKRGSGGVPLPQERADAIPSQVGGFEISGGSGEAQPKPIVPTGGAPAGSENFKNTSQPPNTIAIKPPAPSAAGQGGGEQGNARLNALSDFAASQLVQRSAPRKGLGEVATGKTVTTAPTPSTEDLDTLAEQELTTEAGVLQRAQEGFDARGKVLDQAIAQNAAREAKLAEQYEQRKRTDARLLELQQYAESKERDVAEMKTLSPTDEYFKNAGGPWARVLAGLMTFVGGLGQAHAAAGGMQIRNQALDAINQGIQERSEMLKQEYEQKRQAGRDARNAYSEALQVYGTPEMAMQALNDRGEAIADQKLVILAQKQGNQDALNEALQWQAQRSEARAQRVAERNASAAGQTSTTYGYDRGSGGGASVNWKAANMLLDIEKARGGGDDETQAYAKALQAEGIPQAEAQLGTVRDILQKMPKSGEIPTVESRNVVSRGARAVADYVGGAGTATRALDNETERTVRGMYDRWKAGVRHALSGASLTATEKTDFEGRVDTVNTTEGMQAFTDELESAIQRRKAAIGAGFRPGVTNRYEQRKQNLVPIAPPPSTKADE